MESNEVTRRQARIVRSRVIPMRAYLFALKNRMADSGFVPSDPLFELVSNAAQAVGELYVDLDVRTREGPTELPQRTETPWLNQKSARKRQGEKA